MITRGGEKCGRQVATPTSALPLHKGALRIVEDAGPYKKVCRFFKIQKVHDVIGKFPFTPWTNLMCKCYRLCTGINTQNRPIVFGKKHLNETAIFPWT